MRSRSPSLNPIQDMRISRFLRPAAIATAAAGLSLVGPITVDAQTRSLTWTETTQLEVPGSLGTILRLTGATDPVTSQNALHLQGSTLIQETDGSTVVNDLSTGEWITIDHQARTYTRMSFADMVEMSDQAMAEMRSAAAGAQAESQAELERSQQEAQAEIQIRISAESTGERQQIGGHDATRHFLIAEFESTGAPEGVEDEPEGGTMFFLTELWQTSTIPGESEIYAEWARSLASNPEYRQLAEALSESITETGDVLATSLAAWDPSVSAGMAEVAQEMEKIDGTTVRSILTVAIVPQGVTPDRDELLAWQPSSGMNIGGAVAGAARGAVADAARGALGGLGRGLLGGRGRAPEPEPEPAQAEPSVQALMRMTTTREDINYRESNEDVLSTVMARIADYREVTMAELMGR